MTTEEDRSRALDGDPFISVGTDDDGLRVLIAGLIGRYERAIGLVDDILGRRVDALGPGTASKLRELLLDRIRDRDRISLLRASLLDLKSTAPVDAIVGVLAEVKAVRDKSAHAAAWVIESDAEGATVVAFYPPRRRDNVTPLRVKESALIAFHHRIAWASEWLTHVLFTDPALTTGSDWERIWQDTVPMPQAAPPKLATGPV